MVHISLKVKILYCIQEKGRRRSQGGSKEENFDHATPMVVVFHAAAAQRRARQAQSAEFHIRFATSGLRASPYLEPIPPPSEIHAAALLCLLRGAQRWV